MGCEHLTKCKTFARRFRKTLRAPHKVLNLLFTFVAGQVRAAKKTITTGLACLNCQIGSGYKETTADLQTRVYFSHVSLDEFKKQGLRFVEPDSDAKVTTLHSKVYHFTEEERLLSPQARRALSQPFKRLSLIGDSTAFFQEHPCVEKVSISERGKVIETWTRPRPDYFSVNTPTIPLLPNPALASSSISPQGGEGELQD